MKTESYVLPPSVTASREIGGLKRKGEAKARAPAKPQPKAKPQSIAAALYPHLPSAMDKGGKR